MKNLNKNLLLAAALIIIIIGLKLTSLESGPSHMQNDGYNVSGGIVSALGGMFLGFWFYDRRSK